MTGQIPIVDYLVLDDGDPHLVAQECANCSARFFDRRNACASCFASEFSTVPVPTEGTVRVEDLTGSAESTKGNSHRPPAVLMRAGTVAQVAEWAGIAATGDEIVRALGETGQSATFNKGGSGRGASVPEAARARVLALTAHYPDVDFTPLLGSAG